jgi:hypothetical protein
MSIDVLNLALAMNGNSVTALLVKLFKDGQYHCVNAKGKGPVYFLQDFIVDWKKGGKEVCERHWRDKANTNARPLMKDADLDSEFDFLGSDQEDKEEAKKELISGKHEWIPTNMLAYVIENAVTHNNITWLYLAEILRIETNVVVIHPQTTEIYKAGSNDGFGLSGHVEAIFLPVGNGRYRGRTKGQPKFHEELRNILRRHLSPYHSNPDSYMSMLKTHIGKWYWQGDASIVKYYNYGAKFSNLPCPYFYKSDRGKYTSWGTTMGEMGNRLSIAWAKQWELLKNWEATIKYMSETELLGSWDQQMASNQSKGAASTQAYGAAPTNQAASTQANRVASTQDQNMDLSD